MRIVNVRVRGGRVKMRVTIKSSVHSSTSLPSRTTWLQNMLMTGHWIQQNLGRHEGKIQSSLSFEFRRFPNRSHRPACCCGLGKRGCVAWGGVGCVG
ncbi:hypothetical protein E2C01_038854 [Portunus trituberculatus]|uniref:Uncharacterized protein n=1 Tax=Portunus trituberculatus TaxID=210409 RepID=A0A5B7FI96_PORTR|nr:hypothetical protein [Portunus trituberculatus]